MKVSRFRSSIKVGEKKKKRERLWSNHLAPFLSVLKTGWSTRWDEPWNLAKFSLSRSFLYPHSLFFALLWRSRRAKRQYLQRTMDHLHNDVMQNTRTPFPTIPGSKSTWTFRWIGREGHYIGSEVQYANDLLHWVLLLVSYQKRQNPFRILDKSYCSPLNFAFINFDRSNIYSWKQWNSKLSNEKKNGKVFGTLTQIQDTTDIPLTYWSLSMYSMHWPKFGDRCMDTIKSYDVSKKKKKKKKKTAKESRCATGGGWREQCRGACWQTASQDREAPRLTLVIL